MSTLELSSRLVRAFGKDAAVTKTTAADLKAMNRHRGNSGQLAFSPTLQRDSVQRYWSFGKTGCPLTQLHPFCGGCSLEQKSMCG